MKQQTAVEWLDKQLDILLELYPSQMEEVNKLFKQAKQMEYNQMSKMYNHAMLSLLDTGHGQGFEEYYNENYNRQD